MKINPKFILIDFFILVILFQDQLISITHVRLLNYTDELFIGFLCLKAFYKILVSNKVNKFSFKIFILTIIFSLIGILSCYLNSNFNISHVLLANFLSIKFLLLIASLVCIGIDKRTINFVIGRLIIIGKIAAIVAIFNLIFPSIYLKLFPWGFVSRRNGIISPCSIFEHPGTYGWYMVVIGGYYYSRYLMQSNKKDLYKFIVYAIFGLLSMRAKVILGLVVMVVFGNYFIKKGHSKNKNYKKIIFSFLVGSIILLFFRSYLISTYEMYYTFNLGISARAAFNIYSFDIARLYFPLGVGFGKFGSFYAGVYYSEHYYKYGMNYVYGLNPNNLFFETDTFWPSILGETGFIGIIIYLTTLYTIFKELRLRIIRFKESYQIQLLTVWALIIFFQALVESLGAPTFNSAPQNVIIALIVSMSLSNRLGREG